MCKIKKRNQPSAIQRNSWNIKTLKPAEPISQKEQRYRPRRQQLTHKLADFTFWLCRYKKPDASNAGTENLYSLKHPESC